MLSSCSAKDCGREKKNRVRANPGENISVERIEGLLFHQVDCSSHGFFSKDRPLLQDLPSRTDQPSDACICSSGNEHAVFDRPEGCNGEVLKGRRGSAKPRVIRDGDEEVRSLFDKPPAEVREDDFETDEGAEFPLRERKVEDLLPDLKSPIPSPSEPMKDRSSDRGTYSPKGTR